MIPVPPRAARPAPVRGTSRVRRLLLLPLLAGLVLPALPAPAAAAASASAAASTSAAASADATTYTALEPVRLLDTRTTGRPVPSGGSVDVVLGARVPASARAVVLNVTGLGVTAPTQVEAVPAGTAPTGLAQLPVSPGTIAAEIVVVPVGDGGRVTLHNVGSTVSLLADLTGYYAEQEGAGYVAAATPRRLLDTRSSGGALGAGQVRTLQVTGAEVPAGATAAVLNVTALNARRSTDVRVYPASAGAPPVVSLTNPTLNRPTNAVAIATLSSDGRVSVRNAAGSVDLVVDLQGWYVPGAGDVFHTVPVSRPLVTTLTGGVVRDLVVAGAGAVPAQASAVALTVRVARTSASSDVRAWPAGSPLPDASNLYAVRGGPAVANGVVARVGRDGAVSLRTSSGAADVIVDVAGWWGPRANGWDVSWPQCSTRGSTATKPLPEGGAFAVVGLTRRAPFGDEELAYTECFDALWRWASSLPAEPAVYVNVDAPGPRDTNSGRVWAEVCGTSGTPTSACGKAYGERIAAHALARMPATPSGGKPMVWMDVEGPYADGPFWQTGYAGAVAVNRGVIQGLVDGLRRAGHRVGTYSDRGSVADPNNDWRAIVGNWRLVEMQNWVFRSPDADPRTVCGPEHSFTGGPVVMAQVQPATNPGVPFDVNGLC